MVDILRRKKRGRYFEFEFMEGGQRFSGTFNGKKGLPLASSAGEARDLASAIRLKVRNGTYGKEDKPLNFASYFDDKYMPYSKENKVSWKHDQFRGNTLKTFFAGKTFGQITGMLMASYINTRLATESKRGTLYSPATVNKEVSFASSIFKMAIIDGVAEENPCDFIPKTIRKKIPARNPRDRFLTYEEEPKLFAQLIGRRSRVGLVVRFALETGLRKSELCRLEVEHVNLSADWRSFTIKRKRVALKPNELLVEKSKNGRWRCVPLSNEARRIAEFLIDDVTTKKYLFTSARTGGMTTDFKTAFCSAVRDAGLEDFRFHDLRHTFSTRLNEAGADAYTIRDLLGHSTTAMSADYTHTSNERQRHFIEAMSQRRGSKPEVPVANSVKIPAEHVKLRRVNVS